MGCCPIWKLPFLKLQFALENSSLKECLLVDIGFHTILGQKYSAEFFILELVAEDMQARIIVVVWIGHHLQGSSNCADVILSVVLNLLSAVCNLLWNVKNSRYFTRENFQFVP